MHRQHTALIAVQTVRGSEPPTPARLPTDRSLLASLSCAGLPMLGLLLACSGCYGPYQAPYGGYGSPYGYPPGGVPTQTLQPGGTYTPTPYGQPATPYNNFPQPTPGQPSGIDQTGGSGPFYGSGTSGGSTSQPYDGGGVPTYSDPNEVQFQQPIQPDNTAIDSYGAVETASAMAGAAKVDLDTANFVVDGSNLAVSAPASEPPPTAGQGEAPSVAAATGFAAPAQIEIAAASTAPADASAAGGFEFPRTETADTAEAAPALVGFPGEATPLPSVTTPAAAAPFAHDADFQWLRGVLRFDAGSGNWMMIYSDNPSTEDEHGGKLLVADSPLLEQFKPQAVVLLRGGIDEEQSAEAGRAVFRAEVIEPVELSVP